MPQPNLLQPFRCAALVVASALMLTAPLASAGEGTFGWVYTLDLQPKGELEFEQRVQLNQNQAAGTYQLWQSRTELEYGVTDNFQLAGYVNSSRVNAKGNNTACTGEEVSCPFTGGYLVNNNEGNNSPYSRGRYDGVSLEAIYRLTNPVTSPLGVGLYLEPTIGPTKNELEARILLQSNFLDDKLVVAANLIAATEKQRWLTDGSNGLESMLDVLLGVSYRFAPRWTGGLEARQHNDFATWNFAQQTQSAWFVGPNLHYADKNWWTTVAYRRQLPNAVCSNGGQVECSSRYAWDSHTTNEFILKFGVPF